MAFGRWGILEDFFTHHRTSSLLFGTRIAEGCADERVHLRLSRARIRSIRTLPHAHDRTDRSRATSLRRPSVSCPSSPSFGYGPHPHADTVVAGLCGGRGWEAAHRVMFVSLFTCTRSHVTCRRCHVSTRQVQAGVPGRPERGQDQHHHAVHVRQVRQHLPGACA